MFHATVGLEVDKVDFSCCDDFNQQPCVEHVYTYFLIFCKS